MLIHMCLNGSAQRKGDYKKMKHQCIPGSLPKPGNTFNKFLSVVQICYSTGISELVPHILSYRMQLNKY
jgi:hypothetical protein